MEKGAYVLADAKGKTPELILIATGSEVAPTLEAYEKLSAEGIATRLVSMPSWDLFEKQPQSYRDEVLPPSVTARLAVEAGVPFGWERYVGLQGRSARELIALAHRLRIKSSRRNWALPQPTSSSLRTNC